MNKKNIVKIALDFCMLILFALMYNKMAISLSFHEIGGLFLLGLFLIHILINWKWIAVVKKKLFTKTIPLKTKIGYLLNIMLLLSFLLIGISGIFISKVVFHITNTAGMNWRLIHYSVSALSLILIGIHIGLHQQFIRSMLKKILPIPQKLGRIIGISLTAILFTYGCYSITTTSFLSWLTMPLTLKQGNIRIVRNIKPDFEGQQPNQATDESGGGFPEGFKEGGRDIHGGVNQSYNIWNTLKTLADFFAITYVFATITALMDLVIIAKKKKVIKAEILH